MSPGDERDGVPRAIALGALGWAVFAVAYVALSALVVDETALSAQILTGTVRYPAGHPHAVFHLQAWSLPNQASAALLALTDSIELVSRARNFLVVFLSGFGPYLVATLVSRRAVVGAAASALVLSDALYRFQGVYPTFVFPTFYSHGHVGAWGAVVTVALVAGGFRRSGGLLVGLAPALHPLLGALVWAWCALRVVARRTLGLSPVLLVVGLVASAGSWGLSRAMAPEEEPLALYAPGDDGALVRASFIELTDPHRRLPEVTAGTFLFGYAANFAAFAAVALVLLAVTARARSAAATRGVLAFGALAWGIVWGAGAFETLVGALPDAVVTAMPYRLSNVSAMLLPALAAAALVGAGERSGPRTAAVATLALALAVLAGGAANANMSLYDPDAGRLRLAAGIALLGSALAAGVVAARSRPAAAVGSLSALVLAAVFLVQRERSGFQGAELFGAVFAGTAVALALARRGAGDEPAVHAPSPLPLGAPLALVALAATGVALRSENAEPSSLVSAFDEELRGWLDEHAEPDELLLPPLIPRTQLQIETGHPVLLELGTLWLMPYLPSLSSTIGRMTRDLYGVDYADRAQVERLAGGDGYLGQHDAAWKAVWRRRTRVEWRELGRTYGFRLVVAPTEWGVDLVPEVVSVEWTLYRIPGV